MNHILWVWARHIPFLHIDRGRPKKQQCKQLQSLKSISINLITQFALPLFIYFLLSLGNLFLVGIEFLESVEFAECCESIPKIFIEESLGSSVFLTFIIFLIDVGWRETIEVILGQSVIDRHIGLRSGI